MKLEIRATLVAIGGSLAAYIGFLTMGRSLWGLFDDEKSTFREAVSEIIAHAFQIDESTVIFSLIISSVMLVLHLSGVPKPWESFFRIALALFVPHMFWALSLLALETTPELRRFPFTILGHPIGFLVFFFGGLTWWIVALSKSRRRYLQTGWS